MTTSEMKIFLVLRAKLKVTIRRTVAWIKCCLEVLVISHNNISTIAGLTSLKYITYLDASHNNLCDIKDVCGVVYNWYSIYEIKFIGNPIVKQRQYRENVILSSHKLGVLDNKEISDMTRSFIKRFEQEKLKKSSKSTENIPDWAKKYGPPSLHKIVYKSLITKPSFDNSTIESNVNDIYLPWKALPTTKNKVGKFTMSSQK
ncbi:hypothetical protein RN001_000922 [Aquatica leii]|uniref:Uncharacterized protein n=1 Tax=Aquatica leii TaxID=1421715 RepID=A0AAN7PKP1_9COLE|nr:hypothetical protein RN001_000922 [Aquatica leii]